MEEVMEKILYRIGLSPWIYDALPEFRRLPLVVDESSRGGRSRQGSVTGEEGIIHGPAH